LGSDPDVPNWSFVELWWGVLGQAPIFLIDS